MSSFYKAFDQPFGGPTSTAHDDQRAIEEKRTFSHEVGSCYPKAVRTRFESMTGGAMLARLRTHRPGSREQTMRNAEF